MRLIDADEFSEEIDRVQESLMTNDDNMWTINKPYFKGLAWARGLINDSPTITPYKWISVEDRLPSWEDGKVLIYTLYGISIAQRTTSNRWKGDCAIPKLITHWMPLPALPVTKEN